MRRRKVLARSVRGVIEKLESRVLLSSTLNEGAGSATITGFVYNDLNGDGHLTAGEPNIPGTTVTLAQVGVNYNGNPPPTVQTDITGAFSFTGLAPGQYQLAINPPDPGFSADPPGQLLVTVAQNDIVSLNLGETQISGGGGTGTASIAGTVFYDANADGVYQPPGEPFLSGGDALFLDLNGNGILDPGEPMAFTNNVGHYSFSVAPGSYLLHVIPRTGLHQDSPGVLRVTVYSDDNPNDVNVGETDKVAISGTVFQDVNGNGVQDVGEPPVAGEFVYLDNGSGVPGLIGTAVAGSANMILLDALDANVTGSYVGDPIVLTSGTGAPETRTITAYDGPTNVATVNANWDTPPDATTTYAIITQPTTTTDSMGHYQFTGLAPGFERVKVFSAAGMIQDGLGYVDVTTVAGTDSIVNLPEGLPTSVSGVIFNDRNGNGVQDATDIGVIGQTAYIDLSNDGILNDPSYAITAATEIGDIVTITAQAPVHVGDRVTIQNIVPTDYNGTFTVLSTTPTGFTYQDVQGGFDISGLSPGIRFGSVTPPSTTPPALGPDGMLITGGEPASESSPASVANNTPNGAYIINNLGPGTYTVRIVVPEGARATGPVNASHSYTITLGSGQNLTTQNFGLQSPDLMVTVLALPTKPVVAGAPQRTIMRITNVGSLPAFGTADITLFAQTTAAPVDVNTAMVIGGFNDVPIHLRPGQSRVVKFIYSFPIQTPTNSYFVTAEVTSKNVEDDNAANNFSATLGPISVTLPFVDLSAAYAVQPVAFVDPGHATSLAITVTNLGNVTAVGTVTLRIYLSMTPQLEPMDTAQQFALYKVRLPAHHSFVFHATLGYPGPNLGVRYIIVDVDSGNSLGETNLANNLVTPIASTTFY